MAVVYKETVLGQAVDALVDANTKAAVDKL